MGRKSLGGRAAAVLLENDDELERREKRKTLSSREILGDLKGGALAQGKKKGGVNYDFTSVINLCSANKVNLKNTWSLDLLDHIDDVLELQNGSFQKASCTLQASVQIYEKRVDSTHQDTFKMLENVNRTRIGTAGDAEESRATRKRGTSSKSVSTFLETNLSNITHERVERMYEVDPLFRKMSKTFDAGGAQGLLLNHLRVHEGPHVVFDTSETNAFPHKADKEEIEGSSPNPAQEEPQEEEFQRRTFSLPAGISMGTTNPSALCPSLEVLHRTLSTSDKGALRNEDGELQGPSVSSSSDNVEDGVHGTEPPEALSPPGEEDFYAEDEENGFVFDHEDYGSDHEDDAASIRSGPGAVAEFGQADHENASRGKGASEKRNQSDSFLRAIDFTQTSSYSYFEPKHLSGSRNSSWAGPSHWKFARSGGGKRPPQDAASRTALAKKKADRRRAFYLDLFEESDPEITIARRVSSINLSKKASSTQASKLNDLPEDLHYTVQDLCKLFLKPAVISEVLGQGKSRSPQNTEQRSSLGSPGFQDNYDDNDDAAGFFDEYTAPSEGGAQLDGLVAPSHVVEKVKVNYEKRAKRVDVKKLKSTLWTELEDLRHVQAENTEDGDDSNNEDSDEDESQDGDNRPTQQVSFVDSIASAAPKIDDEDVTVPFYFICLLHLANENNLELKGHPDMADFTIN
mmetsp:Transcript_5619/g.10528  ORF Transcript_5619/g.10528 Transcript_5619/m.10528 type:complete len:688 (-) Transcript_5619:11-2074(-)